MTSLIKTVLSTLTLTGGLFAATGTARADVTVSVAVPPVTVVMGSHRPPPPPPPQVVVYNPPPPPPPVYQEPAPVYQPAYQPAPAPYVQGGWVGHPVEVRGEQRPCPPRAVEREHRREERRHERWARDDRRRDRDRDHDHDRDDRRWYGRPARGR